MNKILLVVILLLSIITLTMLNSCRDNEDPCQDPRNP